MKKSIFCMLSIISTLTTSNFTKDIHNNTYIQEYDNKANGVINTLDKLANMFPKTTDEIAAWTDAAIALAQQEITTIQHNTQPTFATTMQAFDMTLNKVKALSTMLQTFGFVHPDTAVRQASLDNVKILDDLVIDLSMNTEIYRIIKTYYEQYSESENLSDADKLLISTYLMQCKNFGLHVPEPTLHKVKQLRKDISAMQQDFVTNISNDMSHINVTIDELAGVNDTFIAQLQKDGDLYIIPSTPSHYIPIITECSVSETRKKMFLSYYNRAYPANDTLLKELLSKRHELATLLGHPHFANLDLELTSAKNSSTVEQFLLSLTQKALDKNIQEFEELKKTLSPEVTLTDDTCNLWDYPYVYNQYVKNNFAIDEHQIAEYFPMQQVIDGIFKIYQDFLGLTFKQVKPVWSWHEDVILIEIYQTSSEELLGYLFLDLYPRANKFTHACVNPHIGSYNLNGNQTTSISTLITNFPKPSANAPSLLKFQDVIIFFHEFGHAMHHVLGRTQHIGQAGLNVPIDFAETPSQMFEQWLFESNMLDIISGHYKTGEKLPQHIIEKKIELRKSDSGHGILRQCLMSLFALYAMTNDSLSNNPAALWKSLHDTFLSTLYNYHPDNHWYTSFGHIAYPNYESKYYMYLWTKVFALDLFTAIKNHNFDSKYSQKVIDMLSAGGSITPDTLLYNFLGREPNQEAFLTTLGL